MEKDIHNFTRQLRLTEYFANENDVTFDEETQTTNKVTFHPKNRNKTLGILSDYLRNQNFDNAATKNKSNTLSVKNPSVKNFVGKKFRR